MREFGITQLQYRKRKQQQKLFRLGREVLTCSCLLGSGAYMEDRVLKIGAIGEHAETEEVAVLSHAIKGLIERGEALLAIEDEEGVLRAV